MAKSYKICHCGFFDKTKFQNGILSFQSQQHLPFSEESPSPVTKIFESPLGLVYEDYSAFRIEHEHNVKVNGRIGDQRFTSFIRKGEIMGYSSDKAGLLLLSGKKDDILEFCKATADTPSLNISTIEVDMALLLERLSSVKLVWFKFQRGMITASALMGDHIERTDEFTQAKVAGEISTLSFHLEDNEGIAHPIIVTRDGAVVLQAVYPDLSKEIELVLEVKRELLDGIYVEKKIENRKLKRSKI